MNFAALKTALKRFGFDDSDPLDVWLNEGYREVLGEIPHFEATVGEVINVAAGGTGFDVTAYQVSQIIGVVLETYNAELVYEQLDFEAMESWLRNREYRKSSIRGRPNKWTRVGNTVWIHPVPDATAGVTLYHVKEPAELVNNADVPIVPVSFHYAIVLSAAATALSAENEEDRAVAAQANYDRKIARALRRRTPTQTSQHRTVEDVMGYGD